MTRIYKQSSLPAERLKDLISNNFQEIFPKITSLETELCQSENGFGCFLGREDNGRPVMVCFSSTADDSLLVFALSRWSWFRRNIDLFRRILPGNGVPEQKPRIYLVCPACSPVLLASLEELDVDSIRLIRFTYADSKEGDGLFFEPIFPEEDRVEEETRTRTETEPDEGAGADSEKLTASSQDLTPSDIPIDECREIDVCLTPEEIAEFMDFDPTVEKEQ